MDQDSLKEEIVRTFGRALRYLGFRARSEKEMIDYLTKKQVDPLIIAEVVTRLKEENLINDEDFATSWTTQRQEHKGKSKFAIKLELTQKGIAPSIIESTLSNSDDDLKIATAYWEKKKRRFQMYSGDEHFKKAAAFLQRKGYSYEIIKKVLRESDE